MGRPAWLDAVDLRVLAPLLGVNVNSAGMARCIEPGHEDKRPSMQVFKEGAKCHARGTSWAAIDFVMAAGGMERPAAIKWLLDQTGQKPSAPQKKKGAWVVKQLDGLRVKDPATQQHENLRLVHRWDYQDADGKVVCGVARYATASGGKSYRPYTPQADGGYLIGRPPNPVLLYGLPRIADAQGIIVVEGEKVAERLQQLLDAHDRRVAAVAWMGGAQQVKNADWTPLHGKPVYVWPDADDNGKQAAMAIGKLLHGKAKWARVIVPDPSWPPKSDLYDLIEAGWDWAAIALHLKANCIEMQDEDVISASERTSPLADALESNDFFRILGVAESERQHTVVVYRRATGIVRHVSSPAPTTLRVLAPDGFWGGLFPVGEGKNLFSEMNRTTMFGAMSDIADRLGLFDPQRVKGRGWHWCRHDGVRVPVLNTGRHLVANGQQRAISARDEHDIWIAKRAINWGDPEAEADNSIRERVWRLLECQLWQNSAQAYAVAGWVALAPLCGLLSFRPGLWLRGQAGMGKSFLVNHIKDLLGDTLQLIQGESTEPGIRRTLKHDATATLIDEYEVADRAKRANVDAILALMRMAAGEKGGIVLKADPSTPDGVTNTPLRTMMMFSSIARTRPEDANETRIMSVSIEKQAGMDDSALTEHMLSVIAPAAQFIEDTDNVSEVFLHWVLRNVGQLLECVRAGKRALQRSGRRIRFAELHGTLVAAGIYLDLGRLPEDDEIIEVSAALERATTESSRDDVRLVSQILDHRVRIDKRMTDDPTMRDITLAALVIIATGKIIDGVDIREVDARNHLAANGIITGMPRRANGAQSDNDSLLLSTSHPTHLAALRGSRWEESDYGEIIARGIGQRLDRRVYFHDRRTYAVRVQIKDIPMLAPDDTEPTPPPPTGDEHEPDHDHP